MLYTIIGNSTAAIGAVEGIRSVDQTSPITIISNETHYNYSRPLISYLVAGKVNQEQMRYRDDGFYAENNVTLLQGVSATGIDVQIRQVVLSDGQRIDYDRLLVATGARASVIDYPGLDRVKNRINFNTMDDALKLMEVITPDSKILVTGTGLIGLKCVEGVFKRVAQVDVVGRSQQILRSILDEQGAAIVQKHLENQGVQFHLGKNIVGFNNNEALLDDGTTIGFDILVQASGVTPNTELLSSIAQIGNGIIINERSETSYPFIYAAGDCTESLDISSNSMKVMALLPNAYNQGYSAGVNMAGAEYSFTAAMPMNSITLFSLPVATAGSSASQSKIYEVDKIYRRLFYDDNRMTGFIMVGDIENAGIYTALIREKTPLSSIDFELVCQHPSLLAFTRQERANRLAGVSL